MDHICRNVFPVFDLIDGEEVKAKLLKLVAEVCIYTGYLEDPKTAIKSIHEKLMVSDISYSNKNNFI